MRPLYICGPTASGKTSLAIGLARALDGEIINADAYQIYHSIDGISAAPTTEEKAQIPHHLFGTLAPHELCDAMRFRELAQAAIHDVTSRNKRPIVSGGSGLYLKFLTHGPSPVPPGDPTLREELETRSDDDLIAEFTALDPEGAAMTNLQNRRYVIRALEICLLSGQKMSVIKSDWKRESDQLSATLNGLLIQWEANQLRERISLRTEQILSESSIAEVSALRDTASETCRKAIGFREIESLLDGKIDRAECLQLITNATNQYAKRQRTWFRKETWLTTISPPVTTNSALKALQDDGKMLNLS